MINKKSLQIQNKTWSPEIKTAISIIKRILKKNESMTFNQILQEFFLTKLQQFELEEFLNQSEKFIYNNEKREIRLKNLLNINSKKDLINLIQSNIYGIEKNSDLIDGSYKGIEKDIEELKKNNQIKVIEFTKPDKKTLLFPVIEEDKLYQRAPQRLWQKWNEELNKKKHYELTENETIQLLINEMPKKKQKKIQQKMKQFKIYNEWMKDIIDFQKAKQEIHVKQVKYLENLQKYSYYNNKSIAALKNAIKQN